MAKFTFFGPKGNYTTVEADDEGAARKAAMLERHGPTPSPCGYVRKDGKRVFCEIPGPWTGYGLSLISVE